MKKQPTIGAKGTDNTGVLCPSSKVNYKQRPVNTPQQHSEQTEPQFEQIVFADPIFAWLHEYKSIEGAF